jgi:ferredoxin
MKGYLMKEEELSKEEALEVIQRCEEIGLVHFVDNAEGDIQHNCNCCGCVCWNVGPIKRREVPRDIIMATYFLRATNEDECSGCGECIDICPIDAVKMENDMPLVDLDWCIGCGVCSKKCPNDAIKMMARSDRADHLPETFRALHEIILEEKGLI